ncbi:hypothetical protein SBDP1_390003 [Syntrophobacter sp. SbD1]|nr:hypothetical protein SBDP1_390003 [Syntrophobacter sp. SbD1]
MSGKPKFEPHCYSPLNEFRKN